jgi:GAF domain
MVDRGQVLAQLALSIARTSATQQPLVWRLCHACPELLSVDGVALTVGYTTDRRVTVCTTDAVAARLEDLQDVLGEGPGWDAYSDGHLVSARLPADSPERWPMLSDAVRRQLRPVEVLALPMQSGPDPLGVLSVHRSRVFSPDEQDVAQFVADAIGAALARDHDASADEPSEPWHSRSQVHLATGMVVAQLKLSPEDALALIRAYAYAQDHGINDVAEGIIARRIRLGDQPTGEVES